MKKAKVVSKAMRQMKKMIAQVKQSSKKYVNRINMSLQINLLLPFMIKMRMIQIWKLMNSKHAKILDIFKTILIIKMF